jgi:hypothetical protein
MSDEKQGRGRPPKDPLLSGYGETKLLSVKVPAAQYEQITHYIQQRFEQDGFHLGVSDVVRHALVKLGINGIAAGKDALADAKTHWVPMTPEELAEPPADPGWSMEDRAPQEVVLTESGVDAAFTSPCLDRDGRVIQDYLAGIEANSELE